MNLDERAASIDSWRHSVPSRLERKDPFANDGFEARPSTRLVSFLLSSSFSLYILLCSRCFENYRSVLFGFQFILKMENHKTKRIAMD